MLKKTAKHDIVPAKNADRDTFIALHEMLIAVKWDRCFSIFKINSLTLKLCDSSRGFRYICWILAGKSNTAR